MKLAFVCQPFGTLDPQDHSGSIEIKIYEVARRLARSEQVIIYARRGPKQPQEEVLDGVRCKRLELSRDVKAEKWLSPLFRLRNAKRQFFASSQYYKHYIAQVAGDMAAERCDVAHIDNFSQFAPVLRRKNPHMAIVLDMGCEWLRQLDRRWVERNLRSVDRIYTCSDFIKKGVQSQFTHLADRCVTVPNGAYPGQTCAEWAESATRDGNSKKILFVGRVSPEKGLHVLIEAFGIVGRADSEAQLEIIGPEWIAPASFICDLAGDPVLAAVAPLCKPGYLEYLKNLVPLELRERVAFRGRVPYLRVGECYRGASVFVHPSICNEAFGNPIAEAMMNGLPVISVNAGAQPELVEHGKTGIIVERNHPEALAAAMVRLLGDAELRERMGKAGRERAMKLYTWDVVAEAFLRESRVALSTRNQALASFSFRAAA